jgi:lipopolysaccharide transport system ATP-binding protein
MYVRLAFAVAAHLQPEILIVDEVLAVGDAEFQKKCLGKMRDVAASGRTVLFVSHNMATVRQLCRTAILMRNGSVARQGEAAGVVAEYLAAAEGGAADGSGCPVVSRHGIELTECALRERGTGRATRSPLFGQAYELVVGLRPTDGGRFAGAGVNVVIHGEQGALVSTLSSVQEGLGFLRLEGMTRLVFDVPALQLYPGRYTVSVSVKRPNDFTDYLGAEGVTSFVVEPAILGDATWPYERKHGLVRVCAGARVVAE